MAKANRRKLKNVLIYPRYQLKYVFWLSATGLILTLVNCAVFYTYMQENYSILVDLSPMDDSTKAQLYSELRRIVTLLGGFSAVFILAVAAIGMFVSHRTAGPLYHFKRVFNDIKAGKRDARIRLRPGDDFRDVADSFNQMMDSLKK